MQDIRKQVCYRRPAYWSKAAVIHSQQDIGRWSEWIVLRRADFLKVAVEV